jgi:hypothetical protein
MRTEFAFTLTPDEYVRAAFERTAKLPVPRRFRWPMQLTLGVLFGVVGLLFVYGSGGSSPWQSPVSLAAVAMVALWIVLQLLYRAGMRRTFAEATFLVGVSRRIAVDDSGVRISGNGMEAFHPWSGIRSVERGRGLVFLMLDAIHFVLVPLSAFEGEEELETFVEFARQHIAAAKRPEPDPHPFPEAHAAPAAASPAPAAARISVARRMADAFRLAFLRDVPEARMTAAWKHVLGFAFATLAMPVAVAFTRTGWNGEWSWFLLPFALFHLPLVLAAAIAAAYALARPGDVPRLLLAALMIAFAIDVFTSLAQLAGLDELLFERSGRVLHYIAPAWLTVALARYASRFIGPGVRRLAMILACIVLIGVPLGTIHRERSPWHEPYGDDNAAESKSAWGVAAEDAFYQQPRILARDLDAVKPGRPGAVDVFFVGVAGYGREDVFMREVDSVARLFRERFGAEGHAVRLVNNPKSVFDTPIATKTSLAASLKKIASVMDTEEDVLVLFMTSHGSQAHRFSLDLWPMQLHELDPKTLRVLLDDSGIRNRVVVVSACYSGGFVEALQDDHTLVITASAPDRNSFGCSNEATWTYFGKAYFDEALRADYSFIRAFETAKPAIEKRERQDEYTPSDPRISIGAKIVPRLEQLERQLRAGTDTRAVAATKPASAFDAKVERYVAAMYGETDLRRYQEICRAMMRETAPETWLEQDPASFNGLDKSNAHWPRLAGAWEAYSEESCARTNDPRLMRSVATEQARAWMKERDLDAFLAFTATEGGRGWLTANTLTQQGQVEALAKVQERLTKEGYQRYREEQARIFADFQKDAKQRR